MLRAVTAAVPVLVAVVLLLSGGLLTGCSSNGAVSWRDLDLTLPDGWLVYEQTSTVLGIANTPLGQEATDDPDEQAPGRGARQSEAVAAQFQYDPNGSTDDWRELIAMEDGTVEVDEQIEIDGIPASRLVWSGELNGIPVREMIIVIPSRSITILYQPVVSRDATDGPERFLAYRDEFEAVLTSIDFGAPLRG